MNDLIEILRPYLNSILVAIIGFIVAFVASKLTSRALLRFLGEGWSRFLGSLIGISIVAWTLNSVLESAGALGLVVVIATIVTAALALGSERLAADLVAGVSLFVSQVFKSGDFVHVGGYGGRVVNITLWLTTLVSEFGEYIYIRNSDVVGGTIINYSAQPGAMIAATAQIPFSSVSSAKLDELKKSLMGFSPEVETLREEYHPQVFITEVSPEAVVVQARVYVHPYADRQVEKTRLYLLLVDAIKKSGK